MESYRFKSIIWAAEYWDRNSCWVFFFLSKAAVHVMLLHKIKQTSACIWHDPEPKVSLYFLSLAIQVLRTVWNRSSMSGILLVNVCWERHISCGNFFPCRLRTSSAGRAPFSSACGRMEMSVGGTWSGGLDLSFWEMCWSQDGLIYANDLVWFWIHTLCS